MVSGVRVGCSGPRARQTCSRVRRRTLPGDCSIRYDLNMRRLGMMVVAGGVAIAAVTVVLTLPAAGAPHAQPQHAAGLARRGCPAGALRLPPDAVARAADVARHYKDDPRTVIVASGFATSPASGTRGLEVKHQCGAMIARRTVVVDLFYPWLRPSASLTQGTLFVGYFHHGYRVWEVAH